VRASQSPTSGFRGFTLSLVVSQPSTVDSLISTALAGGATALKPAKKQFWGGYSGVVRAPDGTIWKVATSAKKDTGPATRDIDGIVLILGVADMASSKRFYVDHGLAVAKSFGSKYAEFDAEADAIKLSLYKRSGLAKDAGVTRKAPARTGSRSAAMPGPSPTRTGLHGTLRESEAACSSADPQHRADADAHSNSRRSERPGGTMTTHTIDIAATTLDTTPAEDRISDAALHLYEADFALYIDRQSGLDAWVAAAYDRLHEAVLAYDAALAGQQADDRRS